MVSILRLQASEEIDFHWSEEIDLKLVMTCLEYETVDLRTVFDLTSLIIHDASFLYLIGTVRCATGMT